MTTAEQHPESADERIAAFLDGQMDPRRGTAAAAHFAESDDERAVLATTARILRQLEGELGHTAPTDAPGGERPSFESRASLFRAE